MFIFQYSFKLSRIPFNFQSILYSAINTKIKCILDQKSTVIHKIAQTENYLPVSLNNMIVFLSYLSTNTPEKGDTKIAGNSEKNVIRANWVTEPLKKCKFSHHTLNIWPVFLNHNGIPKN